MNEPRELKLYELSQLAEHFAEHPDEMTEYDMAILIAFQRLAVWGRDATKH